MGNCCPQQLTSTSSSETESDNRRETFNYLTVSSNTEYSIFTRYLEFSYIEQHEVTNCNVAFTSKKFIIALRIEILKLTPTDIILLKRYTQTFFVKEIINIFNGAVLIYSHEFIYSVKPKYLPVTLIQNQREYAYYIREQGPYLCSCRLCRRKHLEHIHSTYPPHITNRFPRSFCKRPVELSWVFVNELTHF